MTEPKPLRLNDREKPYMCDLHLFRKEKVLSAIELLKQRIEEDDGKTSFALELVDECFPIAKEKVEE